jgi:hypothetical protein
MQEKRARTIWNCRIWTLENPCVTGFSGGRNDQSPRTFRVSPVMTTSIPLRISYTFPRQGTCKDILNCKVRVKKEIRFGLN